MKTPEETTDQTHKVMCETQIVYRDSFNCSQKWLVFDEEVLLSYDVPWLYLKELDEQTEQDPAHRLRDSIVRAERKKEKSDAGS